MAQAALTRDFDIKRELVVEDDLDKKPDDDEIKELQKLDLSEPIISFVEDLKKLATIGKYNLISGISTEAVFKDSASNPTASYINNQDRWQTVATIDAIEKIYEATKYWSDYIEEPDSQEKGCHQTISLNFGSNGLELKVTLRKESKDSAAQFAGNLTRVFKVKLDQSKSTVDKQIYENTKAHAENNQVFIVTRLPRASIDSLLAEKDAQ
ncbi:MAG TPA: hypothetical protein VGC97_06165 [Pyrinomonadaceae bacterium]